MPDTTCWPNGAQCAVMFTFDCDAETLWISRDPSNWKRIGTVPMKSYWLSHCAGSGAGYRPARNRTMI